MKTRLLLSHFKRNCNWLQGFLKSITLLFLFSILFFSSKTLAQISSGTAPVLTPTVGFAIDGNLKANTSAGDWLQGSGSGTFVLDGTNAGNPLNASTTFHLVDLYNSGMDDNFDGGLKVNQDPNAWTWTKNPVNDKEDINNALVHFSKDNGGHLWVIVAADRLSTNGNAYIDFEFLQNKLTINSDGSFTSAGPDGGRTVGDFILTLQLTNGGSSANFFVERWQHVGGGFNYVDRTSALPVGSTFAAVNTSAVPVTFDAFGSHTYATNAFAEAAVDLTALIGNFSPCEELGIKSLFIKTKESQSPTATIVDFISPSLPVNVTIGVADAGKDQAKCSGGNETIFDLTGSATPPPNTSVASTVWSFASGTGTIDNETTLTPTVHVTSATAKLVLTVTTEPSTCSTAVTDTVLLTVTGLPTVYDLSAGDYCAGEMTHGTITLSGSQAGVSYQLYDASDNTVQAPKTGSGDALIWTNIIAGTYHIIASADGGCSSTTLTATVTKNPLPGTPIVDVTDPTCTKATGTITITSPTDDGLTYSINGTDYQPEPTFNDVAPGNYTVYVMNSTGCISSADTKINDAPTTLDKPAATVTDPTCTVATGTVNVTNPVDGINYTLSQSGTVIYTAINGVFSDVASGTYTFEASNGTCNAAGDDVVVRDQPASPTVTADDKFVCAGSSVALTGSPAGGVWSGDHVTGSTFDATGLSAGPYTVTYKYTNDAGCKGSDDATVTVNALPTVGVSPDVSICNGSSTTLTATGATSYSWSPAIGLSATTGSSVNANPSATTIYTVKGTDGNTCSNSAMVKVTVNPLPPVSAGSDVSICAGGSTTLTASGATSYSWSPATGLSATTGASVTAHPTSTTAYTVTGTDGNTCSNTASVKVTVNPVPSCTITNTTSSGSHNTSLGTAISFKGPDAPALSTYKYEWSFASNTSSATFSGGGTTATGQNVTVTAATAGSYTLTLKVTDQTNPTNCNSTCTYQMTIGAVGPYYTVTQGFYGNLGGKACSPSGTLYTSGTKGNTDGLITLSIKNMPLQKLQLGGNIPAMVPLTITSTSRTFIMGFSTSEVKNLITYMPATQTATVITANSGTNNNTNMGNILPKLNSKKISDVLLGQTITLDLNVYVPGNALGSFVLKTGYLTTQKMDPASCSKPTMLSCTKDATAISSLQITTNAGLKAWINAGTRTVTDLLNLASNALGGGNIATLTGQSGITLTDINNAVDVINNSFDGGRFFLGYYSSKQICPTGSSTLVATVNMNKPTTSSQLTVKAYPNPYNGAINFNFTSPKSGKATLVAYDLTGKKLAIIFESNVDSGIEYNVKYNVPVGNRVPMMYKLTIGNYTSHGMIMPQK